MKVCMISYSDVNDSRVYRYALSLIKKGHHVDFICLGASRKPFVKDSIQIFPIQDRTYQEQSGFAYLKDYLIFFFRSFRTVSLLYFKNHYDIIHYHNIPDFGVFCTVLAKQWGAKVILDIHDVVPEFYMRKYSVSEKHPAIVFLKLLERLSCRYADHVITVTELWKQTLVRRSVPAGKISVIMNVPDYKLFWKRISKRSSNRKEFIISFHGNLSMQTGIQTLIKAISILKNEIQNVRLQLLGRTDKSTYLRKMVDDLDLNQHVFFRDTVPVEKLMDFLKSVDIGVDPKCDGVYSGETLSVKAMEYLKMGIPLIVSRTKASMTYFDESMVLFFKPENEQDLAKRILELYHSPEKRKRLIQNAEKFNMEHSWVRYETTYFSLLERLCRK